VQIDAYSPWHMDILLQMKRDAFKDVWAMQENFWISLNKAREIHLKCSLKLNNFETKDP